MNRFRESGPPDGATPAGYAWLISTYGLRLPTPSGPHRHSRRPTADGNVEVLNETADWYRYFDATAHAEFLYHCVRTTIESDVPYEVAYLESYDDFTTRVSRMVDMPERTLDLLHRFLRQSNGRLSDRARRHEFARLTDQEVAEIESHYAESVAGLPAAPVSADGMVSLRDEDA